jgi:hypothetical protein
MDTTGFRGAHRAEHLNRQAAAEARASYYAHPSLHFHTYMGEGQQYADPDHHDIRNVHPVNAPYQEVQRAAAEAQAVAAGGPTTNEIAEKTGLNEEKKDEEGGKKYAAPATAHDRGARELGGEAGGTHTSPGPRADVVQTAIMAQMGKAQGVQVDGAVQLPDDHLKGQQQHWSVEQAMEPHLQLMCGPMLSYYTIEDGVWHGAAMVVTADEGSILDPAPVLSLSFYPYIPPASGQAPEEQEILPRQQIPAQRIFNYVDDDGPCSFWRFMIQVPLQRYETSVRYRLNGGAEIRFCVPALGQNLRWTSHSCNGFSSGVNPDDFKGKNFNSGYDPMWEDMLGYHYQQAYHCMVGGGDQIYCDAITREPELQGWINAPDKESKQNYQLTPEMRHAIDRFYFNHYCKIFRSNAFGRANATIPMVNMLDDHDLIDGFGTYEDDTMKSPVFSHIGSRGYFWFTIFQLFINDDVDGINHKTWGSHPAPSVVIGGPGTYVPYPSHHLGVYLGPKVFLLAVDCRAERTLHQIVSPPTWNQLLNQLVGSLPREFEHLVVLLGVPIAYPRMSFLEHFLGFKYNPLNALARRNALGMGGLVNKFDKASELLDDLNDHWCANVHKKERNWLVLELQRVAQSQNLRVTFLSGDVHLAAVGCLFTKKRIRKIQPRHDHRYMLNVITSAIVNTPPPAGAAKMVSILSGNKHRTLHKDHTDERMLKLFDKDTDGSPLKRPYVIARRNYASIIYDENTGELNFEIRVEKAPGVGESVPYRVAAPAPRYGAKSAEPSVAGSQGAPSVVANSFVMPASQPVSPVTATGGGFGGPPSVNSVPGSMRTGQASQQGQVPARQGVLNASQQQGPMGTTPMQGQQQQYGAAPMQGQQYGAPQHGQAGMPELQGQAYVPPQASMAAAPVQPSQMQEPKMYVPPGANGGPHVGQADGVESGINAAPMHSGRMANAPSGQQ